MKAKKFWVVWLEDLETQIDNFLSQRVTEKHGKCFSSTCWLRARYCSEETIAPLFIV